jgi:DNA polymerase III epsilon subunit-like protein
MQYTDFTMWLESKAQELIKNAINNVSKTIDHQVQAYKACSHDPLRELPSDYLEFQVQSCLDIFKTSLLNEFKEANNTTKFICFNKHPTKKYPTDAYTNPLLHRARLENALPTLENLPDLAFLDIETDGLNKDTANILQIAIIKPYPNPRDNDVCYSNIFSAYVLPYASYSQKDNSAYHINHIGDDELLWKANSLEDLADTIQELLQDTVIVGYNVNDFDIPILIKHFNKIDKEFNYKFSIDLYPACWKNKKQKLDDAITAFNTFKNTNPHDALADATTCIDLLHELVKRNQLPSLEKDLVDLYFSPQNLWHHSKKIINLNPKYPKYSDLLIPTPQSSLKRKHSQLSTSQPSTS